MEKELSSWSECEISNWIESQHKLIMYLIFKYYGGDLRNEAEDLSQEIKIKLYKAFQNQPGGKIKNMQNYLYRTVQTTLWDAIRNLPHDESIENTREPRAENNSCTVEDRLALEKLLQYLPLEEQQMIRAYIKGFTNEEIATLLNISEGRVRNLLSRTKKKLKKINDGLERESNNVQSLRLIQGEN